MLYMSVYTVNIRALKFKLTTPTLYYTLYHNVTLPFSPPLPRVCRRKEHTVTDDRVGRVDESIQRVEHIRKRHSGVTL
jgi:hypothetical protein